MDLPASQPVLSRSVCEDIREQDGSILRYCIYLLLFVAAYAILFSLAIPTFVDEAYSFNLATDKSLYHLFSALREGADGSFPLYALLIFSWEKLFGSSELSLRLSSGVFVMFLVWLSSRRLGRCFGLTPAVMATLFMLADWIFTYESLQARFYALLMFLFALCFWRTWDLLQSPTIAWHHRLQHALFCGLLCLSHPLGLVYTAILGSIYLGLSLFLKKFSIANALAFLGGPGLFLLWLPSFLHQRLVNPPYDDRLVVAGWNKYWRFAFFNSWELFVTCLVGVALVIFVRGLATFQPPITHQPKISQNLSDQQVLVLYSVTYIAALNGVLALLDFFRIIPVYWMTAIRYVLVCWVPYSVVVAAILVSLASFLQRLCNAHWRPRAAQIQFFGVLVFTLMLMETHWSEWFKNKSTEQTYLADTAKVAIENRLTVVCQSHWDAFYLATRSGAEHITYLLDDNYPFAKFLIQASKYYPRPVPLYPFNPDLRLSEQLHSTNAYLFLNHSPRDARIITPTNDARLRQAGTP